MLENNKQIAGNRLVLKPSDSPVKVSNALSFQNSIDLASQYQRNITSSKAWLDLADGELQAVSDVLRRLKNEYAIVGASDSLSPEARIALSNDVKALKEEITNLANSRHLDRYIFSGFQTRTKPFQQTTQQLNILRQGSYVGTSGAVLYTKKVFSDLPELEKGDYEININYDINSRVATVSMQNLATGQSVALDSNGSDNSGASSMNRLTTTSRFQVNPGDFIDTGRGIALEIPQGFRDGQRIMFSYSPGDGLSYQGDDGKIKSQVGPGDQIDINVTGAELFAKRARYIETTFNNYTAGGLPLKNISLFKEIDKANVQTGDTIDFSGFDHSGNRVGAANILSPKDALLNQLNTSDSQRTLSLQYSTRTLDSFSKNVTLPAGGYHNHDRLAFALQTSINETINPNSNNPVAFRGGKDVAGNEISALYSGSGTFTNRLFATGNIAYDQYQQITLKAVADEILSANSTGPFEFQIFGFSQKTEYSDTASLTSASGAFLGTMTIDNPQVGFKYRVKDNGKISGTDFGLNIGFLSNQAFSAGSTFDFTMSSGPEVTISDAPGNQLVAGNLSGMRLQFDDLAYTAGGVNEKITDITFASPLADLSVSAGGTLTYTVTTTTGGPYTGTITLGPDAYSYPVEIPDTGVSLSFDKSAPFPAIFSAGNTITADFSAINPPAANIDLTGYSGPGESVVLRFRSAVAVNDTQAIPENYSASATIDFSDPSLKGGFFDVLDNHGNLQKTIFISNTGRSSLVNGATISLAADATFTTGDLLSFQLVSENSFDIIDDGSNLMIETKATGSDVNLSVVADPYSSLGFDHNVITTTGKNTTYTINEENPIEDMLKFVENLYGNTIDAMITENGKLAFVDKHSGATKLEVHVKTNNEGIKHTIGLGYINPLGSELNNYYISGNYLARDDNTWNITLRVDSASGTNSMVVGRDNGIMLTIEDKYGNKLLENYPIDANKKTATNQPYYGEEIYVANGLSIRIPLGTIVSNYKNISEIELKGNGALAFGSSATIIAGSGVDAFRTITNLEEALELNLGKGEIQAPSEWTFGSTAQPALVGNFTGNFNTQWNFEIDKVHANSNSSTSTIKQQSEFTRLSDTVDTDGTLSAYNLTTKRYHLSAMGTITLSYYDPVTDGIVGSVVDISNSPSNGIFSSLTEISDYINGELKKDQRAIDNGIKVAFSGNPPTEPAYFKVFTNGNSNVSSVITSSTSYGVLGMDNGLFGTTYAQANGDVPAQYHFETNYNHYEFDRRTINVPYGNDTIGLVMEDLTKPQSASATLKLDFTKNADGSARTVNQINTAVTTSLQQRLDDHFGGPGSSPITANIAGPPYAIEFKNGTNTISNIDDSTYALFGLRKPGAGVDFKIHDSHGNNIRKVYVHTAFNEVYVRDGVSLTIGEGSVVDKDRFNARLGAGAQGEINNLEDALDQILDALSHVGSASYRLELTHERYENFSIIRKDFITNELGGQTQDMIEVASVLERNKTTYESALAMYGKTSKLSLLNFI